MVAVLALWPFTMKAGLPQTTPSGVAEAFVGSSLNVRTVPTGKMSLNTVLAPMPRVISRSPPVPSWLRVPGAFQSG